MVADYEGKGRTSALDVGTFWSAQSLTVAWRLGLNASKAPFA
jgi:hypothetical protein